MSELVNAGNNFMSRLDEPLNTTFRILFLDSYNGLPDFPFLLTINNNRENMEIVKVTGIDPITEIGLVIERAQEGTTAQAHDAGSLVENNFTAGTYQALVDEVNKSIRVVDEYIQNGIRYTKYNNGKIEIAGKVDMTLSVDNQIGDVFRSVNTELDIDETSFQTLEYSSLTLMKPTTYNYWIGSASDTLNDFSFRVFSSTSRGEAEFGIGVYAIGRWK